MNEQSTLLDRPKPKLEDRVWTIVVALAFLISIACTAHSSLRNTTSSSLFLASSAAIISTPRLGHRLTTAINALPPTCASRSAVVLLLRHCEDGSTKRQPDSSRHCNPVGNARAEYLADLFGDVWPEPTHMYVLMKNQNQRQYETLLPLAQQIGVPIQMVEYAGCTQSMVQSHVQDLVKMCQDTEAEETIPMVTVVAWKHAYIPELAQALGCDHCPQEWPDDDFDSVWQLHYQWNEESGKTALHVYGSVVRQNFDWLAYQYQMHQETDV